MRTDTQNARILSHLKKGRPIDGMTALRLYGSWRLGARIWELKRAGHRIEKTMVRSGRKCWARYELVRAA